MSSPALEHIKLTGELEKKDWFFHSYKICSKAMKYKDAALESKEYELLEETYRETWRSAVKIVKKKIGKEAASKAVKKLDPDEPKIKKIGKLLDYYITNSHKGFELPEFTEKLVKELRLAKLDWV